MEPNTPTCDLYQEMPTQRFQQELKNILKTFDLEDVSDIRSEENANKLMKILIENPYLDKMSYCGYNAQHHLLTLLEDYRKEKKDKDILNPDAEDGDIVVNTSNKIYILDLGSGFGGPSRYIAYHGNQRYIRHPPNESNNLPTTSKCSSKSNKENIRRDDVHVYAIELQQNIHNEASMLTKKCELDDVLNHVCIDIHNLNFKNKFHFMHSILTLLHVADLEKALSGSIFSSLVNGATILIEDFAVHGTLSQNDLQLLQNHVGVVDPLRTMEEWETLLKSCGYSEIQVIDVTKEWAEFTHQRRKKYEIDYRDKVALYGESSAKRLLHFYNVVADCFQKGMLNEIDETDGLLGVRIIAKKYDSGSPWKK